MDIQIAAHKFFDYSLFIRGYSKETIKRYRQIINFYCKHFGIERLEQVSPANVRELFLYGRTVRAWSTNTFIVFHHSLNVFFRWCRDSGYLQANPAEGMEIPKLEKKLLPKLSKQDAMRLLEVVYNLPYDYTYLRYRNRAIFATFIHAGLRKKELLHLNLADVDVEGLTIFVRQGKGNRDRIIPMSFTLANILKQYLAERRRLNKTCPEFFTSLNRNTGFTDTGLKRLVLKARSASKIQFTIHKLRHTFATLMLEGGCDIYSLSKMMGHSDISTTTIYLAASAEHLRAQMMKHPLN